MTASTCGAIICCHAEVSLLADDHKVCKERLERQNLRICLKRVHKFTILIIRCRIARAGVVDEQYELLRQEQGVVVIQHLSIERLG